MPALRNTAALLFSLLLLQACTPETRVPPGIHPATEQGLQLLFGQDRTGARLPRDTTRASDLLQQAYAEGDALAARWLGVLAARHGDGEAAQAFYQAAAERGDTMAFEWEHLLHLHGTSPFPVDPVASAQVVAREARRGNPRAQAAFDELRAGNDAAATQGDASAIALRDALAAQGLTESR